MDWRSDPVIQVSYHVLAAIVYGLGVLLLVHFPNQAESIGEQVFRSYGLPIWSNPATSSGISYIWIVAGILQFIGILFFVKWLEQEGHTRYLKVYKKLQPLILALFIFLVPISLNKAFAVTEKTWTYSDKEGVHAIEYIKDKSACTYKKSKQDVIGDCSISLKNYQHKAQAFNLILHVDENSAYKVTKPLYLHQRESRIIHFQVKLAPNSTIKINEKQEAPSIQLVNVQ